LTGYYYLVSCVGDAGTYVLDVTGKSNANGANIEIYQYSGSTNQQFLMSQNGDGSYIIKTRVSGNNSAVEIKDAGVQSGNNVQQWSLNGHACQNWFFESVDNPGSPMNVSQKYEFENVHSKMAMDITDGKMAENTNVQQHPANHLTCQQWILKSFGGNYYYIRSVADTNYVLRPTTGTNGGNICIVPYSSSDSAMLFKFSKNPDGSYLILARASRDACCIEVANGSTAKAANVQIFGPTNHPCQHWNVLVATEEVSLSLKPVKTKVYKDNDLVHTVVFVK